MYHAIVEHTDVRLCFHCRGGSIIKKQDWKRSGKRFQLDFLKEIQKWNENGEKLIVGNDWNWNIYEEQLKENLIKGVWFQQ